MAGRICGEHTTWSMEEDDEGHRNYNIEFQVEADGDDGPYTVRNTAGLPLPGAIWNFRGDIDPVAHCKRRCRINPMQTNQEETRFWNASFIFSTKPDKRCQDFRFEDPLTEPPRLSGTWTKVKEEIHKNRFDVPLKYSSHERMKGAQVEFDTGLPTVKIDQNVLNLDLPMLGIMLHTVNSEPMWGLPIRCVKLSGVSWSQEFYGNCFRYYKRSLEFEVNPNTFDRDIADVGSKVLYGRWERPGVWRLMCINGDVPDHKNPSHFVPFKYPDGTPGTVPLNGKGLPAGACIVFDNCASSTTLGGKASLCPDTIENAVQNLVSTGDRTQYFLSMWDNNVGNSLEDDEIWINVVDSITPSPWNPLAFYQRGQLVSHKGYVFVAVKGTYSEPVVNSEGALNDGLWFPVANANYTGTNASLTLRDMGVFNPCTTYGIGDYVTERGGLLTGTGTHDYASCNRTQPGKIRVEHYSETDLRTLGIPLIF